MFANILVIASIICLITVLVVHCAAQPIMDSTSEVTLFFNCIGKHSETKFRQCLPDILDCFDGKDGPFSEECAKMVCKEDVQWNRVYLCGKLFLEHNEKY